MTETCRHCHHHTANRPRGLCYSCHRDPSIRHRYQSVSKFGRRYEEPVGKGPARKPTAALPGTREKFRVLRSRAGRGEDLFHSGDGRRGTA